MGLVFETIYSLGGFDKHGRGDSVAKKLNSAADSIIELQGKGLESIGFSFG